MKLSRDTWLMILLLAVLLAILIVSAGVGEPDEPVPLSSLSSAPNGAKALKLWLPELGFTVNEELVSEFAPPPGVDMVLILQPQYILESEWESLDAWIEAGGALIVAGDLEGMSDAAAHFDFSIRYAFDVTERLSPAAPLFTSPALTAPVGVQTDAFLITERDDYATHLANGDGAIVVSFDAGKGRVVLSTSANVFTNRGLKNDANAAFVLNLLSLAGPESTVWFDEWHHGMRLASTAETETIGAGQWLRETPIGNAFIFIVAVVVVGLFLQGRAFGRPVPLPREIRRRGVLEHVTAIANLNRRAGHRADVLRQYHQQLKRHLGRRYRIDPSLPDAEYVATLKKFNATLDSEKLLKLLHGLSQKDVSEADMVKLAAEAAEWIKE
ncbi:MAG: DUF4350 domain-containing protein [Chloroflexota bacterium]